MIFKLNKYQPLDKQTDEQLIAAYKTTGKSALAGELFNRYAHLVYGVCLKYIKDKEDCRDMTMVIFEKMLAHLHDTEILVFKKWLFTISKNECLSFLRQQRNKVDPIDDWQEFEKKSKIFMENEDFSRHVVEQPDEKKLRDALTKLKPDQQRCMELFFYKNMSYKEIEQKTEYSALQVKSFLQNGKRNLKLILESEGFPQSQ